MHSFNELQMEGALKFNLKCIDGKGAVELSKAKDGTVAVVADNASWIATTNGIPVGDAEVVYSSNEEYIGKWSKSTKSFFKMLPQVDGGNLVLATIKVFKFKEDQKMADLGIDLGNIANMNMEELTKSVADAVEPVGTSEKAKQAKGFSDDDKAVTDDDLKKKAREEAYASVKKSINDGFGTDIAAPMDVIRNNRLHGRLITFITGTDSVIKVSTSSKVKLDAHGRKILKADASDEVKRKFEEGKAVSAKECVKETVYTFKHTKPSAAKGVIVKIPAGTNIALTTMGSESAKAYDLDNKDEKIMFMNMDTANVWLQYLFGGLITEDDAILGPRATTLELVTTLKPKAKDTNVVQSKTTIKPADGSKRALLIPGNYFPLKVYDTISTQDLTEENKKILNLNFEATYTRMAAERLSELSENERKKVRIDEKTGEVTSAWFNDGEKIVVQAYDNPDQTITNVRIPKREKVAKKSGDGYTYAFVYKKMGEEGGPQDLREYEDIIKETGYTKEMFMSQVERVTKHAGSGQRKQASNRISVEEYLRGYVSKNAAIVSGSSTIADLQDALDQLGA